MTNYVQWRKLTVPLDIRTRAMTMSIMTQGSEKAIEDPQGQALQSNNNLFLMEWVDLEAAMALRESREGDLNKLEDPQVDLRDQEGKLTISHPRSTSPRGRGEPRNPDDNKRETRNHLLNEHEKLTEEEKLERR